jgi:hypothetical protein
MNNKIPRGLRRALAASLFSSYGFDHPRESYREGYTRSIKPYQCPRCQGVRRGARARMCFGYEGKRHPTDPAKMRAIDPASAPSDTPGLDVR